MVFIILYVLGITLCIFLPTLNKDNYCYYYYLLCPINFFRYRTYSFAKVIRFSVFWFFVFLYLWFFIFSILCFEFDVISKDFIAFAYHIMRTLILFLFCTIDLSKDETRVTKNHCFQMAFAFLYKNYL